MGDAGHCFLLTKTPLMYLSQKYGVHHYLYEYFVMDVIIFIITLSKRYFFTYDSNADTQHAHTHTHTCRLCAVQGHATSASCYLISIRNH